MGREWGEKEEQGMEMGKVGNRFGCCGHTGVQLAHGWYK